MKKIFIALFACLLMVGCSSTKAVHFHKDGTVMAVYTDDVFIGTLRDLGLGTLWSLSFRTYYGSPCTYWNPRGPMPAPRDY